MKLTKCCCLDLELGGTLIGWFIVLFYGLLLLLVQVQPPFLRSSYDDNVNAGIFSVISVICLMNLISHVLLLAGIDNNKYELAYPAIIVEFIGLFYMPVFLFNWFGVTGFIIAVFADMMMSYFIIVISSLQEKIRSETGYSTIR